MKKLCATLVSLATLLACCVFVAPAALAVEPGKFEVQNLGGYGGGGTIAILRLNQTFPKTNPKGASNPYNYPWVLSGFYGSNIQPVQVNILPGKCIWEEVWGNGGKTWYGNFNYNNPTGASGYYVTLEGSKLKEAAGIESRLRYIQC